MFTEEFIHWSEGRREFHLCFHCQTLYRYKLFIMQNNIHKSICESTFLITCEPVGPGLDDGKGGVPEVGEGEEAEQGGAWPHTGPKKRGVKKGRVMLDF